MAIMPYCRAAAAGDEKALAAELLADPSNEAL
jgi:hypothetical protein